MTSKAKEECHTYIRIGNTVCPVVGESGSEGMLTISFTGDVSLDEALAVLDSPGGEIRIYEDAACTRTAEIWRAVKLTGMGYNRGTGVIAATLQVERVQQDEAERLQEQIDEQNGLSVDQDAALAELGEIIADSMDAIAELGESAAEMGDAIAELGGSVSEIGDALAELGDAIASLDERVTALENHEAEDPSVTA